MTEKMNPEVKARWVAALRSGAYEQGKAALRTAKNEFCCLGVLCDLNDARLWHPMPGGDGTRLWGDQNQDWELPPRSLKSWAGFDWERVQVEIGGVMDTVYNHNDAGTTFAQIADAIEAQL